MEGLTVTIEASTDLVLIINNIHLGLPIQQAPWGVAQPATVEHQPQIVPAIVGYRGNNQAGSINSCAADFLCSYYFGFT